MFMRRRFISLNDVVYYDYNNYMTIEALEDGVIIKTPRDVEYGINGAGWKKLKKDYSLSLTKGQFISFKCYLSSGSFGTIKITGGKCYLRGNCLSLIHGDGKDLSIHNYAFDYLFENNTSIIGFEASFLRATTLSKYCYSCMFKGCTSLTSAPELPATTLATYCYSHMFQNCTSLTTAPELPATTLADSCYYCMFYGCTSLITPPKLPATVLAEYCYGNMFSGCSSLTTAPELPATTLVSGCYQYMFSGCTALTSVPDLPATTLVRECYEGMFNGCNKLNYIKMLATDISANNCLYYWVNAVASTGTKALYLLYAWSVSAFKNISLLFIDEFDATKETILRNIISNGLREKIDYIELFNDIYSILHTIEFPKAMTTPSKKWTEHQAANNYKHSNLPKIPCLYTGQNPPQSAGTGRSCCHRQS